MWRLVRVERAPIVSRWPKLIPSQTRKSQRILLNIHIHLRIGYATHRLRGSFPPLALLLAIGSKLFDKSEEGIDAVKEDELSSSSDAIVELLRHVTGRQVICDRILNDFAVGKAHRAPASRSAIATSSVSHCQRIGGQSQKSWWDWCLVPEWTRNRRDENPSSARPRQDLLASVRSAAKCSN